MRRRKVKMNEQTGSRRLKWWWTMEYRRQEITLLRVLFFFSSSSFVPVLLLLVVIAATFDRAYTHKQFLTAGFIDQFAFASFLLFHNDITSTIVSRIGTDCYRHENVQKEKSGWGEEQESFSHRSCLKIINKKKKGVRSWRFFFSFT